MRRCGENRPPSPGDAFVALTVCAEGAGMALACPFSSSAEFEASLITARRAAGVYGPKAHSKLWLTAGAATACALAVIVFLLA